MWALVNIALPSVAGIDFEAFLCQIAEEIIDTWSANSYPRGTALSSRKRPRM